MAVKCVFCQITRGEQEADCVYEEGHLLGFLDITPLNRGHTVLIPKDHYASITIVPTPVLQRMMLVAQALGSALMRATDSDGFNFFLANGRCAGQVVLHAHMHIIPRYPEDGLVFPSRGVTYKNREEKEQIIDDVQKRLRL